jgi:hypothetical protein
MGGRPGVARAAWQWQKGDRQAGVGSLANDERNGDSRVASSMAKRGLTEARRAAQGSLVGKAASERQLRREVAGERTLQAVRPKGRCGSTGFRPFGPYSRQERLASNRWLNQGADHVLKRVDPHPLQFERRASQGFGLYRERERG